MAATLNSITPNSVGACTCTSARLGRGEAFTQEQPEADQRGSRSSLRHEVRLTPWNMVDTAVQSRPFAAPSRPVTPRAHSAHRTLLDTRRRIGLHCPCESIGDELRPDMPGESLEVGRADVGHEPPKPSFEWKGSGWGGRLWEEGCG